jgi:phospho-N-acetylmuramoyl-pentapeptide-transferase
LPYFGLIDFSYFYAPFVILIFLGTSNGTNLTDGLDGLLSIPAITSILTFAYLLFYKNNYSLLFYSFVYIGAILGFLWYNGGFAEIFMGDTGSMSIGGTIAALAVFSKFELLLPICGIIFVIESLSVIIQVLYFKMTGGKRFFKMAPIHHHFEKCDLPEQKIVIRFWIIAIIAAIFSIFIINMCIF